MEPFQQASQIQKYRRRLGMPYTNYNRSSKMWFFVEDKVDVEVLLDTDQQITVKLFFQEFNKSMVVSMIYAKCDETERIQLWVNLHGSPLTWWNGRAESYYIFKRLDRMLYNDQFHNWFGNLEVEHLFRTGSDRAPRIIILWGSSLRVFKTFQFKLKNINRALSKWSIYTFGDIFKQLSIRGDIVRIKEHLFKKEPTEENRMVLQRAQAELKLYLHYEEEFWRQKSSLTYFSEGDKNSRFFHSLVKSRKNRIQVKRIQNVDGAWLEEAVKIADEAVDCYFKFEESGIWNHVPELVGVDDNLLLQQIPTMDEVKKAVFELSGDSACGSDGFSSIFIRNVGK
ncbi:uncharacterized protein LOC132619760 [Lycium barbarum]|uniref:uncharacterized protein LOC132619760 n=1 Tax=Lycium barbarum TaxID=112863 RepID=UPI00293E73DB|nr:uncharacterized protein LOC132619760 [Lycium barbarum]